MPDLDYNFILRTISSLTRIPIRLITNNKLMLFFPISGLKKDPVRLYLKEILEKDVELGYYVTQHFQYYGILNGLGGKIIIGPVGHITPDRQELKETVFLLGLRGEDAELEIEALCRIPNMTLDAFTQLLSLINYIFNQKIIVGTDLEICSKANDKLPSKSTLLPNLFSPMRFSKELAEHNEDMFILESALLNCIKNGDADGIKVLFKQKGREILTGNDIVRHQKNIFITSLALVSRSAIASGMPVSSSFSLSDTYIQRCESLLSARDVDNLMHRMILDYADKIAHVRAGKNTPGLIIEVKNYIKKHWSESIKTDALAKALYFSKSNLSFRFKEETGMTLNDFILKEKIKEAKRLLIFTRQSISAISEYLAFSSQSHFQNTFKKYECITPKQYRQNNKKFNLRDSSDQ